MLEKMSPNQPCQSVFPARQMERMLLIEGFFYCRGNENMFLPVSKVSDNLLIRKRQDTFFMFMADYVYIQIIIMVITKTTIGFVGLLLTFLHSSSPSSYQSLTSLEFPKTTKIERKKWHSQTST